MQVSVKRNAGCLEGSIAMPSEAAVAIQVVFGLLFPQAPHGGVSREVALFGVLLLYVALGISRFWHARFSLCAFTAMAFALLLLDIAFWDGQVMFEATAFALLVCSAVAILCCVRGASAVWWSFETWVTADQGRRKSISK